jgi:hypothetical protein
MQPSLATALVFAIKCQRVGRVPRRSFFSQYIQDAFAMESEHVHGCLPWSERLLPRRAVRRALVDPARHQGVGEQY